MRTDIEALILAGGKGSRFGSDKAQMMVDGKSLLQHLVTLCQGLDLRVNLAMRPGQIPESELPDGSFLIEDRGEGGGVMAVICHALQIRPEKALLVLACDMPGIKDDVLQNLIDASFSSNYVRAIKIKGKEIAEPLLAVYKKACVKLLEKRLEANACSLVDWMTQLPADYLEIDDESVAFNINEPSDLNRWKDHTKSK